jgi:hypothetical protein
MVKSDSSIFPIDLHIEKKTFKQSFKLKNVESTLPFYQGKTNTKKKEIQN